LLPVDDRFVLVVLLPSGGLRTARHNGRTDPHGLGGNRTVASPERSPREAPCCGATRMDPLVKILGEPTRLRICADLQRHRGEQRVADLIRRLAPKNHFQVRHHANRLAEAGAVRLRKHFDGEKVETLIELTCAGKKALQHLREEINLEERAAG
jgi:DNA-binding transcriptional ArsR family regulator